MTRPKVIQILKYLGLVVGCVAKFTSGSLFVFNAYQNAIKSMYNYTQSEVELLSSALNLGLGTGFLPGMLYDRFGPFWTSGSGLLVSGIAYFLIWSTTKSVDFYKTRSGLVAVYFYFAGFGSLFSYMSALNTNVVNFPAEHRGKVIGLLNACFTGSPSIFALLYYHVFSTGDYNRVENQDFSGFMLFFAILFVVMNLLCMLFLHDLSKLKSKELVISNSIDENSVQVSSETSINHQDGVATDTDTSPILQDEETQVETSFSRFLKLVKSLDFQLLCVSFTFAAVLGLVNTNNITVITKAVGLSSYDNDIVISMPVANTILSLGIGPLSDKVKAKCPRLTFFLASCVFFTLAELVFIVFASSIGGIFIGIILVGFGIGILWTLVPTIVSELFGISDFGRNWGILLMLSGLGSLAGQAIFGKIYDSMITEPGSLYCYGTKCFLYDFIFMAVLGLISIILAAILDIRLQRRQYNQII
ncbi:hypothetical protein SNE40_010222 [Patella caerulea]|uniref:Major facilitator superfamily (MFS) profile domain-containing protein n=1 Tax=Patella caerulea TaxID=87958 RepID=A0AAN8JXI4_PATCE